MSMFAIIAPYMGAFWAGAAIGAIGGFGLAAIVTAGKRHDEDESRAMSITTTVDFAGTPEQAERLFAGGHISPNHMRALREAEGYAPPSAPLRLVPRDRPPPPRR